MSEASIPESERRYAFMDGEGAYFYAGTAKDGRQVLLFTFGAVLLFDIEGNLLGSERREPPERQPYRPGTGERIELDLKGNVLGQLINHWSTPEGQRSWEHSVREEERIRDTFFRPWLAEFDFQPGTIFVEKFDDPVTGIRVADLPDHYAQFLADPDAQFFGDDDRTEYPEMIEEWLRRGMFVIRVGNHEWLWMTGDGEVNST